MPFFKSTIDTDQGEWFLYGKDADGTSVRFKVRRLSSGKEMEIERRHAGRKGEIYYRKGDAILPVNRDTDLAAEIDKAVYALLDSENCRVIPQDRAGADDYAQALGFAVEIDKPLLLDGKWGKRDENQRYPLKELFLSDELIVGRRIIAKARKLGVEAIEEEERGKDDSSPT